MKASQIADIISGYTTFEHSRVSNIARVLGEQGVIPSAKRGARSVDIMPSHGVAILIGCALSDRVVDVPKKIDGLASAYPNFRGDDLSESIPNLNVEGFKQLNFSDAIEALIQSEQEDGCISEALGNMNGAVYLLVHEPFVSVELYFSTNKQGKTKESWIQYCWGQDIDDRARSGRSEERRTAFGAKLLSEYARQFNALDDDQNNRSTINA